MTMYFYFTHYDPGQIIYLPTAAQYRVIASCLVSPLVKPTFYLELDEHPEEPGADVIVLLNPHHPVPVVEPASGVWLWRDNIWTITYEDLIDWISPLIVPTI